MMAFCSHLNHLSYSCGYPAPAGNAIGAVVLLSSFAIAACPAGAAVGDVVVGGVAAQRLADGARSAFLRDRVAFKLVHQQPCASLRGEAASTHTLADQTDSGSQPTVVTRVCHNLTQACIISEYHYIQRFPLRSPARAMR